MIPVCDEEDSFIPRTQREKRIHRLAKSKGIEVEQLYYNSDRTNYEMVGDTSGWVLIVSTGDHIWGRNMEDILREIEEYSPFSW